ncbi:MAG: hypothetical protein EOO71_13100 [Myxococcaceae bacterium]|nr:MAG: hypothetical protein EOO71_13100 [Myxococcaceae bacterium]
MLVKRRAPFLSQADDDASSAHDKAEAVVTRELQDGGAFVAEADGRPLGCVFFPPMEKVL